MRQALRVKFICKYIANQSMKKYRSYLDYTYRIVFSKNDTTI